MKFKVTIKLEVFLDRQTVEVEADSSEAAEDKVNQMWADGEFEHFLNKAELDDMTEAVITCLDGECDWVEIENERVSNTDICSKCRTMRARPPKETE